MENRPKDFYPHPSKEDLNKKYSAELRNAQMRYGNDNNKNYNRSLFYGFVLFLILCVIVAICSNIQCGNETMESIKPSAYIIATNFVSDNLKSPSTADYPWYDESFVIYKGNNLFFISSYVDAQNSFGAKIRSTWYVAIKYKGGDKADKNNWELVKIEIKE